MTDDQCREQALIDKHIELDPRRPAVYEARLKDSGVHVWAIAGYYRGGATAEEIADGYRIPLEAVEAALSFYRCHREVIDARLAENEPILA